MKQAKQKALEKAGWKVGDTSEFLGLSDDEAALIEIKLILADELKASRKANKLTQAKLAEMIGSSQSRVAKMEAGDPSVSTDLLFRGLIASGVSLRKIGRTLGRGREAA